MHALVLLLYIILLFVVVLLHVAYATYFERKIIGHMQVRMGSMEVCWYGILLIEIGRASCRERV